MKIIEKIKKCFSKKSYSDERVFYCISIFIGSVILLCVLILIHILTNGEV